ncbi:hypothetical protein GGI12_003158 [Dipsacomyces acuminosporus]|nr:hypothetical protein GGI12_003158 [Dipsacomyces acuminosporus]
MAETADKVIPASAGAAAAEFLDEPLLLRMDLVTADFHETIDDDQDRRLFEIVAKMANVNPIFRHSRKSELEKYKEPGEEEATRNVLIKYASEERRILQSGTLDLVWGLKWLFSYEVLIEIPVLDPALVDRMINIVARWLAAMARAGIDEVSSQMPNLRRVLDLAKEEIPASRALADQLPGKFNTACSLIYAGELRQNYVSTNTPKWVQDDPAIAPPVNHHQDQQLSSSDSPAVLTMAQAQEIVADFVPPGSVCTRSCAQELRVDSVIKPTDEKDHGALLAMVHIFDREKLEGTGEPIAIRLDDDMAPNIKPGFVIEATLHTLDTGIHYIDQITMIWPSYSPLDYMHD